MRSTVELGYKELQVRKTDLCKNYFDSETSSVRIRLHLGRVDEGDVGIEPHPLTYVLNLLAGPNR
jgi:hypothetical protein